MKILVTGGAGFIGSHFCELAVSAGHEVTVLDNFSFGNREWLPKRVQIHEASILDYSACVAATHGVDAVVHLAAMSRSGPSIEKIEECSSINEFGTLNVLRASKANGVRKFVYSGSATFYGNQAAPQTVGMASDLLNPYGLTKHIGELWTAMFSRVYDLNTTVLRFFNVYGPRQPNDGVYGLVIGMFLRAAASGEPLSIHGDGSQRRDFIHVRDVARAILASLDFETSGKTFNVGSGQNYSVKQIADLISDRQIFGPRREGDAEVTLANIEETEKMLDWSPEITLETGVRELVVETP